MMSYPFFKKEIKEIIKTHKFLILGALFMFFAILSPILARYMNEIFSSIGGLDITLPETTFVDSYEQFYKNITTLCFIVLFLIACGTVVGEKTRGSLILVLSKGLDRKQFILMKTVAYLLLLSILYWISAAITILYTSILFDSFYTIGVLYSLLAIWVYGIFFTILSIFISTISVSFPMSAGLTFLSYTLITLFSAIPKINKFSPAYLANVSSELLKTGASNDLLFTILISLLLSIALLMITITIFKKQEL